MSRLIFKIIFASSILFWACQTKPFKKIQVKGHLYDSKTKQPIYGSLVLKTDDIHATQGEPDQVLISGKTLVDGSFILKCNASKRKNPRYYLFYKNDTIPQYFDLNVFTGKASLNNDYFSCSEKQTTDVGDIYVNW